MKKKETDYQELFVCFYFIPLLISISIVIFIEGEVVHNISGIRFDGFQARALGVFILLICSNIIYSLLYKIPKQNYGIENVKIIIKKLLTSVFIYVFLITTILLPIFIGSILPANIRWIVIALLLLICFLTQRKFVNDVRKYIK